MLITTTLGAIVLIAAAVGSLIMYRRRTMDTSDGSSKSSYRNESSSGNGSDTATDGTGETGESERDIDGLDQSNAGGTSRGDGDNRQSAGDTSAAFEDRVTERTLDRLEPIAPDAVERIRKRHSIDRNAEPDTVNTLERDLRQVIEDALDEGQFDPTVTSVLGGTYDVVNLPRRFRELTVPPEDETVHVAELEAVVRDALDDHNLHDIDRTIAAVHNHCREINSYVRRREESYLNKRRKAERTLADIQEITDRFDGALADRVREFVVDGRHEALPSIVDIKRRLDAADRSLHSCAFDDANRVVRNAGQAGDDLLMAVDFLGGVTGTIDHGSGRVGVPDGVAEEFVADLVPILERQYAVGVELDGSELVVTSGSSRSGDSDPSRTSDRSSRSGYEDSGAASPAESASATGQEESGGHEQLTPDVVVDEILFVLRELDGRDGSDAVECQTERLPDAVARYEVLKPLATFCRRQTDLVASVTLQENAPPGFFEIEFREGTTVSAGLNALRDRFTERHGV